MQKIILASSSKQRQAILAVLNIPFEIIPANIDEKIIRHSDYAVQAEKIARAKAEKVALENEGIIIAGDTFSECAGELYEKPNNIEEAKEMLGKLSGQNVINHNGFCYIDKLNRIDFSTTVSVNFKFREFSQKEIEKYVETFPVTTWAAAFSPAYPYTMTMIDTFSGSFTGFTHGLPMEILIPLLKKSGFDVRP